MKASHFLFQIPGSNDMWDLEQIEQMPRKPEYLVVLENKHRSFKSLGKISPSVALIKFS